jgi:SAM-dependent methyltransferase
VRARARVVRVGQQVNLCNLCARVVLHTVANMLVLLAILGEPLKGAELYETIYRLGYSSEGLMVHYNPILSELKRMVGRSGGVHSVLDVGCSHGGGVKALWKMGLNASGIDVSKTAVNMARERQGDNPQSCVGTCWQQAAATALPFSDSSFDAIVSTDVLEHLDPPDVDTAVAELARVAQKWMLLKISNRPENTRMQAAKAPFGNGTFAKEARRQFRRDLPPQLHASVHGADWWIAKFKAVGFVHHRTIHVPSWACCAFVLRNAALAFR